MSGIAWFFLGVLVLMICAAAGWHFGSNRTERTASAPAEWWVCASCHSVNQVASGELENCYACRRPPDPASVAHLETARDFTVSQQLGGSRKGGWDRDVSAMLAAAAIDPATTVDAARSATDPNHATAAATTTRPRETDLASTPPSRAKPT